MHIQLVSTAPGKATSKVLRLRVCFRTKDSSFSYRQDQVARLGERARPETTEEDRSASDGENCGGASGNFHNFP